LSHNYETTVDMPISQPYNDEAREVLAKLRRIPIPLAHPEDVGTYV
jgi:hypothetical protein